MNVWIGQDLCTGDGLCEEIAPAVFTLLDEGFAYVKDTKPPELTRTPTPASTGTPDDCRGGGSANRSSAPVSFA